VQRRGEHRLALLPQPRMKTRRQLANDRNLPPKTDKFPIRKAQISKMRVNTDQTAQIQWRPHLINNSKVLPVPLITCLYPK
jgi:hypothetical protein